MESERRTDTTAVPRITLNNWAVFSPSPRRFRPAAGEGNAVAEEDAVGVGGTVSVIILVGLTSEFVTNPEDGETVVSPEMLDGIIPPGLVIIISTGDAVGGGIPLVTSGVKLPSATLANLVL